MATETLVFLHPASHVPVLSFFHSQPVVPVRSDGQTDIFMFSYLFFHPTVNKEAILLLYFQFCFSNETKSYFDSTCGLMMPPCPRNGPH